MAFDLLYYDRRDLTAPPLRDRRARLEDAVADSELVFPVRRLAPDGLEAWNQVIERGYEGYVAKDESSAYGGRTDQAVAEGQAVKQKGWRRTDDSAESSRWHLTINHWRATCRAT